MKASLSFIILFPLSNVRLVIAAMFAKPNLEVHSYKKRSGTEIVLTGAALRIVKETAFIVQLQETGWLTSEKDETPYATKQKPVCAGNYSGTQEMLLLQG